METTSRLLQASRGRAKRQSSLLLMSCCRQSLCPPTLFLPMSMCCANGAADVCATHPSCYEGLELPPLVYDRLTTGYLLAAGKVQILLLNRNNVTDARRPGLPECC
jgi:hypothetical protein